MDRDTDERPTLATTMTVAERRMCVSVSIISVNLISQYAELYLVIYYMLLWDVSLALGTDPSCQFCLAVYISTRSAPRYLRRVAVPSPFTPP